MSTRADLLTFTMEGEKPHIVKVEVLETIKGFKRASRKEIMFNDFLNIINDSYVNNGSINIGKLPNGFYDGSVDINGKGFDCIVIVSEGIKPIIYYDKTYTIPFPELLFFFKVSNGRIVISKVFALKNQHVTDSDILYFYPFGNVHLNGSICWGNNTVDGINSFREVEKAISMFFGSSTNDDLWQSRHINVVENDPRVLQRGLIESLVGKKKFPQELLVGADMRVGGLLKSND